MSAIVRSVNMQLLLVAVLCAFGSEVVHSQFAGDPCVLEQNGKPGVCKSILQCPSAKEALQKKQVLPQTCGFVGTTPIVCCPSDKSDDSGSPDERFGSSVGQKSKQKCKEYAKHAYTISAPVVFSIGPPKNVSRLECPFNVIPLVVGGEKAKPKEFPHSAAIGYESADGRRFYHCGGSLISENFVLSAGHCLNNRGIDANAKYVRVGDLNLVTTTDNAKPQEYEIAEFIRYPDYRPPSTYNDIILFRLKQNVVFNHYVRPICLFTESRPPTKSAIATGWGKTENDTGSDDLLKVTLDFFTQDECYKTYNINKRKYSNGIQEKAQICAGSRNALKDTCQGDSGGPLQIYHSEVECSYLLVGITSFGKFCGQVKAVPAVYTRVSNYIDWIERTVWP